MHHREPPSPELQQILAAAWAALARGAEDPRDDLHWPVLASVTAPASEPLAGDARTQLRLWGEASIHHRDAFDWRSGKLDAHWLQA
jgi:hypothetical protein